MTANPSKKIKPKRIEENTRPMIITGIKREYSFGTEMMNIPAQWEEFATYFGTIPGQKENIEHKFSQYSGRIF